jgi:hypothetical protein
VVNAADIGGFEQYMASSANGGGGVDSVPEPGSLVLACWGAVALFSYASSKGRRLGNVGNSKPAAH